MGPNDKVCYTKPEVDKIVRYTQDCDLCKLNYQTMTDQYNKCLTLSKPQEPLIGNNLVFVSTILTSILVGFLVGAQTR